MSVSPRTVHIPAGLTIDEASRPEILEAGQANLSNVNVRADERGALNKRLGFAAMTAARLDGTTRSEGNRLCAHDDRICVITSTHIEAYSEDKSLNVQMSRVPEASVSTRPLAIVDSDGLLDVCLCNGYIATAATFQDLTNGYLAASVETTDGIVARAQETITSTLISTDIIAAFGTYGNYIVLFVALSTNVSAYYLDTTSAATVTAGWQSIGNLATDKNTTPGPANQLSVQSLTDRIAFAYVNSTGGTSRVSVKTMTIGGVSESTTINTSSTTPNVVAIEGSISDTLWVSWNESTAGKLIGLDADSLATVLATAATVVTYSTAPTKPLFIVSSSTTGAGKVIGVDGDGLKTRVQSFTTSGGAVVAGTDNTIPYGYVYNRPFRVGSRFYAIAFAGDESNSQSIAVVVDWTDSATERWFRPVANTFPNLVPAISGTGRGRAHHVVLSATQVAVAITVQRSVAALSPYLVTLDFADSSRWRSEVHNGSLFLSSGVCSYFDGRRCSEVGFLHSPVVSTSLSSTGLTGTFSYVATYEEVDNDGNWCISGVSEPVAAAPANNTVTVAVTPLVITARRAGNSSGIDPRVRVRIWRTQDGGEAPYYLLASLAHDEDGVSYADTTSDATLSSREILYGTGSLPATNGSGQDRRPPPFVSGLVSYNGMLVVASGSDLWWSGQTIAGEGTWFSPAFYVPIDGSGDVTALATMDGTLYAFKERRIYALSGDAPSDNGSSGGLGFPRRLAIDVGSTDGHVCITELGAFFRSHRGIELLDRGGGVTWIGEQIQDTLADYPIVSSMVLDERGTVVRISLAEAESGGRASGNGRDIVFDIPLRGWVSKDDKRGGSASQASQDAAFLLIGGVRRYAWLGTDGIVYYEKEDDDSDAYLDGSSWVTAQYETPPIKLGLQQEQRVYDMEILFERYSAAGLTIEVAHDGGAYAAVTADKVWTESATSGQRQLDFRPKPRGSSVKLRVKDTAPVTLGTGQGFSFIGLSADITPIQGSTRGTPRTATSLRR